MTFEKHVEFLPLYGWAVIRYDTIHVARRKVTRIRVFYLATTTPGFKLCKSDRGSS
jgi:hypothetical protein